MFELSVCDHIASAHFLPGYEGPCKNLHGHTWKIEVTVLSGSLDKIGMVIDFQDIKKKLKAFLKPLDHVCLNDLEYFKRDNPTTENIAKYVYKHFAKEIVPLKISKVRVWESDTSSVTYYE
ncbi:MAG TPA: 6-carboxytetrahydropterin synthase QueD [Candidatus Omnitrophota bacterium]|nr:6-carboxytetrahydropterin synthase QueD [Candidatus Omnitrophota bacterium]